MRIGLALGLLGVCAQAYAVEYNRDVRPILSDKCFACHGPDAANRKTKLRLDTESGAKIALKGGKLAIADGKPDESEIFRRVTLDNKALRMPPAYAGHDKLNEPEIAVLREWITEGAQYQPHWSFLPPKQAAVPEGHGKQVIDAFVRERLQREGLTPLREADRQALIRRFSFDLTGLPPSPADVNAFVNDTTPGAYGKVVDRLLASPAYAERMAFRWMEAARYADTNGYQSDGQRQMWRWRDWVIAAFQRNMPFNQFTVEQIAGDLLPNATLDQKIATAFHRNHRTTAEGGIVPEEFRTEYVADRAETTSTVWLGLTVGCARCHDHKYDPILQKDFYRLFAFFNNVPEKGLVYNWGNDEPLIKAPTPEQQAQLDRLNNAVATAERQWSALATTVVKEQRKWEQKKDAADWILAKGLVFRWASGEGSGAKVNGAAAPQVDSPVGRGRLFDGKTFVEAGQQVANFDYLKPFTFAAWVKPEAANGSILSHDQDYVEGSGHGLHLVDGKLRLHVVFRWTDIGMRLETAEPLGLHEWKHVLVTYDGKRYASGVHMYVNGQEQKLKVLFDELNWPMDFKVPFRIGAGSGLRFQGAIDDVRVYDTALSAEEASIVATRETVPQILRMPIAKRTAAQVAKLRLSFLETAASAKIRDAREAVRISQATRDKFEATIPTVMVMKEGPARTTHLLKRGAYDSPGEVVTAGVPSLLPQLRPEEPQNRLGLARWLVDRSNPLTARVAVNRFWQMLFGTGLVKTVDDFGSQGEWPIHGELLDWLAVDFMESGWDVKRLLKTMVMSETYRQSSHAPVEALQKDPDNRLLARGPRLRLGPEAIRDQALSASGLLVQKLGGPSVKPYQPAGLWQELAGGKGYEPDKGEGLYRRSLYTYWKRTIAPPFMVNFDSPTRETCTVRESRTNTPLQALNLMNDVMFLEAARILGERMVREGGSTPEERIGFAYGLVLARKPKLQEVSVVRTLLERFQKKYDGDPEAARKLLTQGTAKVDNTINTSEAAAYTAAASLLLNLDEAVTKP